MSITDGPSAAAEARATMAEQVEHVRHELAGVRTGRASIGILDSVRVDAYGSHMPLNQVASLSVPESTLLMVNPFDPSHIGAIERGIQAANLGLNPTNDGKVVRIPVPPLTDDRRKELSRIVHQLTEDGRNSIRGTRRQVNDALKKLLKGKEISEDDERRGLDDIQKITDAHISQLDDLQKAKDSELLDH
jgi:ribosome recycling factor